MQILCWTVGQYKETITTAPHTFASTFQYPPNSDKASVSNSWNLLKYVNNILLIYTRK